MYIHSKYFTTQFSIFNSSFFSVPALLVPERQFLPAPEWVYVIIVHNILHYTPRIITLLLKGRAHEQVIKYACESTCTHLFPHIHVIGLCSFHKILRRKKCVLYYRNITLRQGRRQTLSTLYSQHVFVYCNMGNSLCTSENKV